MLIRKVNQDECLEAVKISTVAFEAANPKLPDDGQLFFKQMTENPQAPGDVFWDSRYAAFDDDGKMMASMLVLPFTAYFDGKELPMTGIGDVSTLPQYRRHGAIRACFAAALEDMYKNGTVFSYLYPFSYKFYRKFGYEQSAQTVFWKIALRALPKTGYGGSIEMYEPGADMSGFNEAYNSFASDINFMLKRDDILWKRRVTGFSPYNSKQWSFLWRDDEGTPKGLMSYQSEIRDGKRLLVVRDLAFDSPQTLHTMLGFLCTFASQYDYAEIPMPPHIPLNGIIGEPCFGHISRRVEYIGMLRVVNVKKALRAARYGGTGRFVISVTDENIDNNNGFFAVSFNPQGAEVTITDEAPDIETDIQGLSRLISGSIELEQAQYYSGITINSNTDILKKAFYKKPLWINDYF